MSASKGDIRFYLDVLKGDMCRCERPKGRGKAFCRTCFFLLPGDIQRALYQPLGGGFEDAYEAACAHLTD